MTTYSINHEKEIIFITEAFEENTRDINTPEFETLMKVKSKVPGYVVKVVKGKSKLTYKDLTFTVMELYIANTAKDQIALDDFNRVKEFYNGKKERYGLVKSWFLKKYPNLTKKDINELKALANPIETDIEKESKKIKAENSIKDADEIVKMIKRLNAGKPAVELILLDNNSTQTFEQEITISDHDESII